MRFWIAGLPVSLFAVQAPAHDFWLQPLRFQVQAGTPLPVTIQVGHGPYRQRWAGTGDRVLLLADIGSRGRTDHRRDLRPADAAADLIPMFATPGLHVLVMQTTNAVSELPGIRFNDYAKVEGLTPALAARARTGRNDSPGREIYSRRAKALIQVGPVPARPEPLATRPIGLSLEIVPDRDPYALGPTRILPVHVMFEGRRLAGATVKLTSLEFDARPLATVITDREGRAAFRVPPVGEWLVNVIWTKPISGDPRADFQTTFSSLTFGYDPARRGR